MRSRLAWLSVWLVITIQIGSGAMIPSQANAAGTVTLRSTSTFVPPGSTTTFTVARPAGLSANDVMVAALSLNNGGSVATPTGWTAIGRTQKGAVRLWTYYRVAGASEAATYTWTAGGSAAGVLGIAAYVGVDPINPLANFSSATGNNAKAAAPAVTVTASSVALLLLTVDGSFTGTVTYPAAFTQRWALVDFERGYAADNLAAASGTLPAATITLSAGDTWAIQQVALRVMGPPPTVTSVTPNSGSTAGGSSVTVSGSGFQSGASVSFGGSPLTVATVTATSITGTTTAHAAGAVNVTVTNLDTQSGTCVSCFTYVTPAPVVTSVTPNSGAIAGGTSVTVNGTGFQSGATVSFGGSALTVSTISATSITGTTTAHAAGAVSVAVTNPDTQTGTCSACFTYVAPGPTVSSVTPNSGASAGGTAVTVAGTGFQTGATVSFGGSALTVSTISATAITGTTSAHAAGAVNVTVTNPDTQSGSCTGCFTYVAPAPTVTSVTPNSGSTLGGTAVTIAGADFQSGATVSFGGSALSVSTISATAITGTTTANAAGPVNVVVTDPDTQSGTCTGCFTYLAPPPPTVTSVTPNSGASAGATSVTIAGTDFQTGATVSFGGSALTVTTISASAITGTTTAHAAGVVNVTVTNPDTQSGTCTGCFTYAAPAPVVSVVTPNSGASDGGTSVTISGTDFQAGATVSFGGSALTVSTISATSITGTTTAHAAGAVNVAVTNPDTQSGTCSGCFTYLAPAPTVSSVTPTTGSTAGGTSVTLAGSGFVAGATVSFGGSALTVSTISASAISGTTTAHAAGAVNVVVTNPDTQSGTCTGCFTYLAPAPVVSSVTPNGGAIAGGTSVTIAGTDFQAGATVSFGGSALTVSTISATSITGTTTAHAAGVVNVVVTNTDAQSGTCNGCFTYLAPAPTVSSVTPSSGATAGGTSVTIAGSDFQSGATVSFGGSALTVSTISATSIAGTTTAHAAGAVNVAVTNPDTQSGTCTGCFTYLAPAPTVDGVTPSSGASAGGTSVTVTGTGFVAGATVSFGGSALTVSTISATSITGTTTAHAAGAVSVVVTNTDTQSGTCSGCFTYLAPAPVVSSVTPTSGPTAGGTSVTVAGTGFVAGAAVSFGGSALTVSTISATSITGTTTAHAAGAVNVIVTNVDTQSGTCSGCFTFVAPAPTVSGVTPSSGSTAGGTSITITGTGFQTGATASLGGSVVTVSTISATSITGTTTAHAAGAVNVVVTNTDAQSGTCSGCFTYLASAPTVTSVTPNSGAAGGGTAVTVAGSGFQTGATVSFGGSALTVSAVNATSITGVTTAHASGAVNVVVTNPDTQSGTCSGCFTYVAAPTVTSVTPISGAAGGGTSVSVAGTGFAAGATVSFGGSALTVSTINATTITGTTTAHAAGSVNVVVTNPDAQSGTCSNCFTYAPAPTVTGVTPTSGPTAGGTSVTIAGTGFQAGATVSFGGSALTVSTISASSITGTTTAHAAGAVSVTVTNVDTQSGTCNGCFTYVAPAPTVTSVTPSSGPTAGGTSVTVAGTGFQTGATVSFGGSALTVSTTSATSITGTTTAHATGSVNVVVTNPDTQIGTCSGCFTYVAPAPTVTSVTPSSGAAGGGTSVTVAGTGFAAGATVSFGGSALTISTINTTTITGTTTAHAAGSVSVVVTNTDTQSGTCASCFTYVAAPTVTSITPNGGPAGGGTSVTVAGTGFQSGATVSFGGSALTVATINPTAITGTTSAHVAGAVNVVVTNADTQSGSCSSCFTYVAAPTVTGVAPTSGTTAGGTSVTVSGTGFQAGATVSFGGSALTVATINPTAITGTTTAHAAGAVSAIVTNPDTQSGTCSGCFTYVAPAPTVASVTPNSGATAGGTSVTVAGTGFGAGATVSFGGSAMTVVTIADTSITGTTTAHAAGSVNVIVTNTDTQSGTCISCFTYLAPAPTVSSLAPTSGPAVGGTSVTITGTGFQSGATASLGGSPMTVSTVTGTSITGTTTAHAAGAVSVTVTNPDAQSGTCTGCFTYVAAPTVSSVTPSSGASAGGTSVTVAGTGFAAGATVSFGSSALTVATISATSITGTTTAHAAGAVTVTVTNPDTQSGTCIVCFTYIAPPPPTVTSVTPNSGASSGGSAVTVNGTGFLSGATVSFGGSALTVSTISATSITGTTTAHAVGAVNVTVTNPEAQSGTCSACFTYLGPAPTVSSVTPNSGANTGGTSVTIAGTDFQAGATVSFGGSALTVSTISATSITGTTPAHAAGAVNVVVTNTDTQSGTCTGCFTYVAPASVTLRATSTVTGTNTYVVPKPAGLSANDVMVASLSANGANTMTPPAGWTLIAHTQGVSVVDLWTYYRVAGASEPASYTWTAAASATGVAGIAAYVGVDPVSPLAGFSSAATSGGSNQAAAPAVTTTAQRVALLLMTIDGGFTGTVTYPTGFTQRWAVVNYERGYEADNLAIGSGNVPAATIALSGVAFWSIQQVALKTAGPAPAPSVTSVTPNSGSTNGGTSVTVAGTGFQSGATVSFGGSALTIGAVTPTSITGTTTAHAAGSVNVTVTNTDTQNGACSACFTYVTPAPPPTVSGVAPNSGLGTGGTAVTIAGSGFQSGATVSFGGSALTVSTVSATSIAGTTTAHASGVVNVVVTNADAQTGTCASCFTYVSAPPPTVSSVTPSSGTSAGGTAVTIAGTGFQTGATITFGGAALTATTVNATSITGTTSVHAAGAVNVVVSNPDLQSVTCTNCYTYTAAPAPTVSSVTPTSGSTSGGTSVTISGSNFQTSASVSFGGSPVSVATLSATTITGVTTAHAAGAVTVSVTNPDTQTGSCAGCFTFVGTGNAIQSENALPGTAGWNDFAAVSDQLALSGYGSKISVSHGESIDFFITTKDATVSIDIFRTGYYGGVGARRIAQLGSFPGRAQAIPAPDPVTGMIAATSWTKTTTVTIPSGWVTGVYLAKLTGSSGHQSFIYFVVRNDGGFEKYVFQTSVTTYQAYNLYGGVSLYSNSTNKSVYSYAAATKVSFDRPFNPQDSNGAGQFFFYEYPWLRWAESQGYDLTYITDIDTDTNVNPLTNHKAFLSIGHDEYWSKGMRDNVTAAMNAGVNLGFFSGNVMYWQIRFESNSLGAPNRVQVGYKSYAESSASPGPDPLFCPATPCAPGTDNTRVTGLWRNWPVSLPEQLLVGVMSESVANEVPYVVQNASSWVYTGTGLANGNKINGIVGYEYDRIFATYVDDITGATITLTPQPGLVILSNSPVGSSHSNSTLYSAPSGARVFAGGTIEWSSGLDSSGYGCTGGCVSPALQQTTRNILANFGT